tara:strand:- start:593 stop:832 length:240 start_codon:yes stop_codon:yes gene_type:complete
MTKAEEILEKHLANNIDQRTYLRGSKLTYNICIDALNEAINYTRCCKSDSEQLCDCKKHSIKTNYGFEVCTKCGNEFDN